MVVFLYKHFIQKKGCWRSSCTVENETWLFQEHACTNWSYWIR